MYFIRDTDGDIGLAFTFKGALKQLALGTAEAAVFTFTGRWVATRRQGD